MSSVFLGLDPGKSGAIAAVRHTGEVAGCVRLDETEKDISEWLREIVNGRFATAYLERVSAMPKQGVSSTFKFGVSYGFLRGLLIAHGVPFEEITPRKWQQRMGCLSGGDKNVTKARAQQLFPQVKVIHANADALLMAELMRRDRVPGDKGAS